MAKTKGVSSKTHTQKQIDDYANQHNPNNKAYRANQQNKKATSKKADKQFCLGDYAPADWFCYSNPYDLINDQERKRGSSVMILFFCGKSIISRRSKLMVFFSRKKYVIFTMDEVPSKGTYKIC